MGSGVEAARESNETVKLLEGMLVAGVDKETAVKLINSVLILKSYDESFATIDMLVLDLYTGYGEFIKTGSVGSYIKKGKKVVCVRSSSLPTGIVGVSEPAKSRIRFSKGDIIVIASDGVTEVIRDDSWIREVLKNVGEESAKEISDNLLNKALKLQSNHTDDMTVLAVKITEK
jgi:stage II sporulation protein E